MNAKSGKAGSAISPAEPKEAEEADKADPGEMEKAKGEQRQSQTGKYGSIGIRPHKLTETNVEGEEKKSWIEIEMIDEENKPVSGTAYRITLPDDSVAEGTLDNRGLARLEGFGSGSCTVEFPELDQDAWEKLP